MAKIPKPPANYGQDIRAYNEAQVPEDRAICALLAHEISAALPDAESKVWHRHPVWFLAGNPIVGYVRLKAGMRLLFWSGQSFDEPGLVPEGSFKAAEARYGSVHDIDTEALRRWLRKGRTIQWDYKNIVKRKGKLERLTFEEESASTPTKTTSPEKKVRIFTTTFASVYPLYVQKAERKARTRAEVDEIITWLTGYDAAQLRSAIHTKVDFETFFADAPRLNPNVKLITGVVCGVRVEEVADPLMQKIRYLDKLIDELAKGKKMASILRQ